MDWDFEGEEFDEESKMCAETRKIVELPERPISVTCVRVPVLVGHAEAVWVETEELLSAEEPRNLLGHAPGICLQDFPTPHDAAGIDDVLVGRIRRDPTVANGLVFFVVADNLRKGAALNAIQIAERLLKPAGVGAANGRLQAARERPAAARATAPSGWLPFGSKRRACGRCSKDGTSRSAP